MAEAGFERTAKERAMASKRRKDKFHDNYHDKLKPKGLP